MRKPYPFADMPLDTLCAIADSLQEAMARPGSQTSRRCAMIGRLIDYRIRLDVACDIVTRVLGGQNVYDAIVAVVHEANKQWLGEPSTTDEVLLSM